MAVTILTSASGAPGVTTTALGLTLAWPDSCLMVDADYQQAVLTGYLQGHYVTPNGLVHVMNAARISPDVKEAVWRQSVPLPEDDEEGIRRLLLPGLPSAQALRGLNQSWPAIAASLRDLGDAGVDVIVDLGRLTPQGVPGPLLEAATQVLLLCRPTLRSVGAAHWAAQLLHEQTQTLAAVGRAGLVLVRRPVTASPNPTGWLDQYSDREIGQFLPLKVLAAVTDDPIHARLLSDGGDRGPKWCRSAYAASLDHLAHALKPRSRGRSSTDLEPDLEGAN